MVHPDGAAAPAGSRYLSTSWRNDAAVLAAANRVAEPLRRPPSWVRRGAGRRRPRPARPARRRPGGGPRRVARHPRGRGRVGSGCGREALAGGPGDRRDAGGRRADRRGALPGPVAVPPGRGRPAQAALPVEVVGLGGLLHVPEVAELRAALEVLHDPTRGDSLVRLLAGPAVRLGPAGPRGAATSGPQELLRRWGQAPVAGLRETAHQPSSGRGARRAAAPRLGGSRRAAALRGRQEPARTARWRSCATCAPGPAWRCPTSSPRSSGRSCSTSR